MCADEQIGAPAQATIRRRGSSAVDNEAKTFGGIDESGRRFPLSPIIISTRSAAARMPIAPAPLAASANAPTSWRRRGRRRDRRRTQAIHLAADAIRLDRSVPLARRRFILDQEIIERRAKWRVAFGRENIARACGTAASRDDFEQPDGCIDSMSRLDHADLCRAASSPRIPTQSVVPSPVAWAQIARRRKHYRS